MPFSEGTSRPGSFFSKHSRQRTGRCMRGTKGTVVETPHLEQLTAVSTRRDPFVRFALHFLQCLGSCWNCFSLKKSCSPALKTKSSPQLTHFNVLSVNSMLRQRALYLEPRDLFVFHALKLRNSMMGRIDCSRFMYLLYGCAEDCDDQNRTEILHGVPPVRRQPGSRSR
jgi:hypothetical protein